MLNSLSRPTEHKIADEVPWVRPPAGLESGKKGADVLVMETGPSGPHLNKDSAPAFPCPQGGAIKRSPCRLESTCERPVEASVFFLASLAVFLLSRLTVV